MNKENYLHAMGIDVWKEKGTNIFQPNVIFFMEENNLTDAKLADELLDKMLQSIKLNRKMVEIISFSKTIDEILPILKQRIKTICPKILVALGDTAAALLSNATTFEGIEVIFTYHPAHLLKLPHDKRSAYQDLLLLQKKLG